ncbi:MAG TPA: acetyl-CoA carboxylase carboxyltransferase subunit alpha [Syntrophothermus lipocalidus]|uniref:Acetyl-coenzyme A carboxylase carboxyl transferase subunit alpha n=1 Tax=Syntrophothermus lipocalidus (strain DSM 12680 / TGB-C1) TaxID=643648 RepID=D7CNC0_SYNLT|nr:acetyl-CoA carboxylase, carboxyl transferase, alpha subunit [Syntrophothermus lipocalidus DSM 12680]HHV75952.1 acetyl-CoA carboxylase carboxyltransferase subunit alpha [Syntrophothermus lipocalidus]
MPDIRPLDFERDYLELKAKLEELKDIAEQKNIDLAEEISSLESKVARLKEERYQNLTPWQKYQIARHPNRPTTLDYIGAIFTDFIELHGDRCFGEDPAIVGGLARFEGLPVTVVGHQRGKDTNENLMRNFGCPHPEGYRKAQRLMRQAEKFGRPVICFIDTQGAFPGIEAEQRGQGWAISQTIMQMASLKVPCISVVIGEGGSGGALALGVADRVLMLSYSVYSVISPEGCASILWNDASRAEEMARYLKMTAPDLAAMGVIDEIVPEPLEGAHRDNESTFEVVKSRLRLHLRELMEKNPQELVHMRYRRLRKIGVFSEDEM